jgi:hypothetical protein
MLLYQASHNANTVKSVNATDRKIVICRSRVSRASFDLATSIAISVLLKIYSPVVGAKGAPN